MIKFLGVEYSRGATAKIINGGPALAPRAVQKMFPNADWDIITPDTIDEKECMKDRFGDTLNIHKKIYQKTPHEKHKGFTVFPSEMLNSGRSTCVILGPKIQEE